MKVVVIGAGIGGVAISARLAQKGYDVTVVEKNEFSGGRCSIIEKEGYRFDAGPSLYLLPRTFAATFEDLHEDIKDHLTLYKCDPNYTIFYDDGDSLEFSCDMAKMRQQLERVEPNSFASFLQFLQDGQKHLKGAEEIMLQNNFERWYQFFHPYLLPKFLRLHILQKLYARTSSLFKTDKLRQAFTFQTMYMGISPYDAPATFNLLQYSEFAEGVWYPKGGMHAVVAALERIGKKSNVKYRFGTEVAKIDINTATNKASGVVLTDGTVLDADIVVCNADLSYCYEKLLPQTALSRKISEKSLSSAVFVFYWAMDCKIGGLTSHNIILSGDYKSSFDTIFKHHDLPEQPSFYVHVCSKTDKTAAPEGTDCVTVLVPVGHITTKKKQDWSLLQRTARKAVLGTLKAKGVDLEKHIKFEIVNSPETWRDTFNLKAGAALGLAHDIFQCGWFRPSTQHPSYKNVYFCGASVHPGTGVPIVLACAKLVAKQISQKNTPRFYTSWVILVIAIIFCYIACLVVF